jgi:hypothetical protein
VGVNGVYLKLGKEKGSMAGPGGVYWPRGNTILDQVNFDLGF